MSCIFDGFSFSIAFTKLMQLKLPRHLKLLKTPSILQPTGKLWPVPPSSHVSCILIMITFLTTRKTFSGNFLRASHNGEVLSLTRRKGSGKGREVDNHAVHSSAIIFLSRNNFFTLPSWHLLWMSYNQLIILDKVPSPYAHGPERFLPDLT